MPRNIHLNKIFHKSCEFYDGYIDNFHIMADILNMCIKFRDRQYLQWFSKNTTIKTIERNIIEYNRQYLQWFSKNTTIKTIERNIIQ